MNYLCIDYWTKKSWLAISINNIAIPLKIVETSKLIAELKNLINERKITSIVFWKALNVDWTNSLHAKRTRSFSNIVKNTFPEIRIIFHDERFSSFEAKSSMLNIWETKFDAKKLDDIAATIVLQSYLDNVIPK